MWVAGSRRQGVQEHLPTKLTPHTSHTPYELQSQAAFYSPCRFTSSYQNMVMSPHWGSHEEHLERVPTVVRGYCDHFICSFLNVIDQAEESTKLAALTPAEVDYCLITIPLNDQSELSVSMGCGGQDSELCPLGCQQVEALSWLIVHFLQANHLSLVWPSPPLDYFCLSWLCDLSFLSTWLSHGMSDLAGSASFPHLGSDDWDVGEGV